MRRIRQTLRMDALRADLGTMEARIREIRASVRHVKQGGHRCGECNAPGAHVIVRRGRNLSHREGKDLYNAKKSATVLLTIIAMQRGKIHSKRFNRDLANLILLGDAIAFYSIIQGQETGEISNEQGRDESGAARIGVGSHG